MSQITQKLSFLDRYLTLWLFAAIFWVCRLGREHYHRRDRENGRYLFRQAFLSGNKEITALKFAFLPVIQVNDLSPTAAVTLSVALLATVVGGLVP